MKHLRDFYEGKQIQNSSKKKKSEVEEYFLSAYRKNYCSVSDEFPKIASEFYVYDDYYLYDNNIYHFSRRPSGDWYHTEITLCKFKPSELIKDLEEELDKIEKAIEKLAYGHDV